MTAASLPEDRLCISCFKSLLLGKDRLLRGTDVWQHPWELNCGLCGGTFLSFHNFRESTDIPNLRMGFILVQERRPDVKRRTQRGS